jgi:hypothetical protein
MLLLSQAIVPTCFKETTIVPEPKKNKVTCRVALTSVIMKCFQRQVMAHIKASIPGTLDPLQFPYSSSRYAEDTVSIDIHTAVTHLEKRNTYVRMLFIG